MDAQLELLHEIRSELREIRSELASHYRDDSSVWRKVDQLETTLSNTAWACGTVISLLIALATGVGVLRH